MLRLCVLCILTSKHMLVHVFAWPKTIKNKKNKKNYFFHYAYKTLTYVRLNQASTQAMPSHAFKAAQLKTPTKTEGYSMSSSKLL